MAFKMEVSQMKIAEKLVILNDRSAGMLTRIYNIKKACGDSKSKPMLLSDKHMEGAIKHVVRKFPVVDARTNPSTFHYANTMKEDITKGLSLYYYTFVDLLDLKDNIMQLLTTMDACQCRLDIQINYELTAGYLNLVVNLISLMILLSRIEDKKAVLGLYNAAYDLQNGQSESSFPRLGQMILDYDSPLRKLHEDLGPLNRLIFAALSSLSSVYTRRNITADAWRSAQILSLTSNPQQLLYAAQTDTIACEYLSLDVMDRWIIFCGTVCHSTLLNDPTIFRMWQLSLQMGICLRVFRDEVFTTHQEIQSFLDSVKGNHKKSQDVKDCYSVALQQGVAIHADRRRFLRSALRELTVMIKNQPGLLGPKVLFVWMALCFSRDEVLWLLRHLNEWPSKKGSKQADELADKQLPELLHYMLELREMVLKHSGVIQRYYLQYVSSYDSIVAADLISQLQGLQPDEAVLLADFAQSISNINSDTDLRALRLDWFRFQAYTSLARSKFSLHSHKQLAVMMNTAVFHLKMIDLQDEMLRETSDLSIYCFYQKLAEHQWRTCLHLPAQCRYVLSFARLAAHFTSALHEMCPEERAHITEKALGQCNMVLDEACRKASDIVYQLCEYELRLSEQVWPSTVAAHIIAQMQQQKKGQSKAAAAAAAQALRDFVAAGEESHRVDRHTLTIPDKLMTTLLEFCAAVSLHRRLFVCDHVFAPREYLSQCLEAKFVEMLHTMVWEGQPQHSCPRRPSEFLLILQTYTNVYQNIDSCVTLDINQMIKTVLLQQTQLVDSRNRETITAIYTKWYLEVLLRRASSGQMVWSEHLMMMLESDGDQLPFVPEQYTDPRELIALVQIIGPYGVKFMAERFIWHVASQINEMVKNVLAHKEVLITARSSFENAEKMREILHLMSIEPKEKKSNPSATCSADAILQRTIIIGQICSFRDALHFALRQVIKKRLPFIDKSFEILYQNMDDNDKVAIGEMTASLGVVGPVDISLANAILAHNPSVHPDDHYNSSCLLLVGIAICLPRIALSELSTYRPTVQVSKSNCHCVPLAVNTMASALFHVHGRGDIQLRMKEFLALASSGIVRIAHETDGRDEQANKNQMTLYIILEQLVRKCRWLTMDILEACVPYDLVRTTYQQGYENDVDF